MTARSNLRRMKKLDDRTGRLERAIDLLEDGERKGVWTTRRERDLPSPRPIKIGLDRASLRPAITVIEPTGYTYNFGMTANSNFERPQVPVITVASTYGTVTFYEPLYGYGEQGYGVTGYGGTSSATEESY